MSEQEKTNDPPIDKEKKSIKEKIQEKIMKDKERVEIRKKNLSGIKEFEYLDFESVKFDYIQKICKKFTKITEENKAELLEDTNKINFTRVLEELIKNIVDAKFDFKDVNAIIIILSSLNQIYDGFSKKYSDYLKKHLNEFNDSINKSPPKNEEEEEKRNYRKKALMRLYIESYCYGLINDFKSIHELFVPLLQKKEQTMQNFPILVNLMKVFAEVIFRIKPKSVIELTQKKELEEYDLNYILTKEQGEKYLFSFRDYFNKVILTVLEEEHKNLLDMEKKNLDNLKKLDSNQEIQISYTKQRQSFFKLTNLVTKFSEIMNFELPELVKDNTLRYDVDKKSDFKLEKINKYDPFPDEFEYIFYTTLLNLKEKVSLDMLEKKKKSTPEECKQYEAKKDERHKLFDKLVLKIIKADCKEMIDEATIDFLKFNTNKYRKSIIKAMSRGSKSNYSILKYYARFFANLNPYFKEFTQEISSNLFEEFNILMNQDKVTNLDERIKNIRFICELIKFELFPMNNVFEILRKLNDDFKGNVVDILCSVLENAGRYLYLNEASHLKFNSFIDTVKQKAFQRLGHDERAYNSIISSLSACKPNENLMKKAVKVRSMEENYIRYLVNQILCKEKIKKVAVILRRMDWETQENIIFKVIYKYLLKGKETQIVNICCLLSVLKETKGFFVNQIIDTLVEEIRICFDRNDFNDNQHKMLLCLIIAKFYSYKIVDSTFVFDTLYMILTYNPEWNIGRRELCSDNILDNPRDTSRVIMITTILDNCGSYFKDGSRKEKLEEFIHFFQIYILTKYFIPLDIENLILNTLENLFPNIQIYNDFTSALKDSKKFKFNFDLDEDFLKENESHSNLNLQSTMNAPDDELEFRRKKEDNKEINFNVDDEIQKIINESMAKNRGTRINNQTIINPLNDIKKKVINKGSKLKLITKQQNKVVVKEIEKNV